MFPFVGTSWGTAIIEKSNEFAAVPLVPHVPLENYDAEKELAGRECRQKTAERICNIAGLNSVQQRGFRLSRIHQAV
jgi:hypothetical protein